MQVLFFQFFCGLRRRVRRDDVASPNEAVCSSSRLFVEFSVLKTETFLTETSGSSEWNVLRLHHLARVFHRTKLTEERRFLEEVKFQSPSTAAAALAMDCDPNCTLVLCGKSPAENEAAKALKNSNALKLPESTDISIFLQSESEKPVKEDAFGVDSFMSSLSTSRFGRFLLWSPRLPSTHDVVSKNFCELPVGAVCVADVQYKGRGRSKNVWESPEGCLLFSFTLQMEDGRVVPLIQYVVSLAVTEAIKDVCDKNGLPSVDVKIKWPNDLYLNDLKVGGILCTSTYKSKQFNVSAGIGLNVDNEKPTTCLNTFLRELSVTTYKFTREDVLAAFFNKFEMLYEVFINQGFQSLEEVYYRTWLHSGQRVIVQEKSEDQVVENVVTIQGLTSSGYLLAIGDDNQMCELHPDGNSFDFFKGLVRRKLD